MPVVTVASPLFKVQVVNNATTVVVRETNTKIVSVGTVIQTGGSTSYVSFTAGASISVGDVLAFNNAGRVVPADSAYPSSYSTFNPYEVIGIARTAASIGGAVIAYTSFGESYPVNFDGTPTTSDVGKMAYLTSTVGKCTLTAPSSSAVVVEVGIINSADGTSSANIVFSPRSLIILP